VDLYHNYLIINRGYCFCSFFPPPSWL